MLPPIQKIIVTGDILRVNHVGMASQDINIRWFYHLLHPVLRLVTPQEVWPLFHANESQSLACDLYRTNHQQVTLEGWISLYERQPSQRDMAFIYGQFSESLVIAFELPEFLRQALDELEIPYMDFTIHPVRFMDDLLFGVRSNIKGMSEALRPWGVSEDEICLSAGLAMSMLTRMPPVPQCKNVRGAALFCAQTTDDKVLIRNGRFLKADDFMQDFADMCARHERVLVKPHPMVKSNPVTVALTRLFPNTLEVDANFYHLLAQEAITHVYSITSSTSIEATYFGKTGVHFSQYPYSFSNTSACDGNFLAIKAALHTPAFWKAALQPLGLAFDEIPDIKIPEMRSRMRRSLRSFWGADVFEVM